MIAGMIVGCLIAVVAGVIGHFQGYLMGVKVRNVTNLLLPVPSPTEEVTEESLYCLCTHGKQTHSQKGTGGCYVAVRSGTCACMHFVAKPVKVEKPKKEKNLLDL